MGVNSTLTRQSAEPNKFYSLGTMILIFLVPDTHSSYTPDTAFDTPI